MKKERRSEKDEEKKRKRDRKKDGRRERTRKTGSCGGRWKEWLENKEESICIAAVHAGLRDSGIEGAALQSCVARSVGEEDC